MWCTRWFLPLLLLPLPTAPPIFLLLFLFTLTMHAKPCFYCIILLATLFVSTCYWSPISLDAPLSEPWTENITTFAEALNSTLSPSYSKPLPSVIQPADRCWCDVSTAGFFEPFNTGQWEKLSVLRLKESLESQERLERGIEAPKPAKPKVAIPKTIARSSSTSIAKGIWSLLRSRVEPDTRNASAAVFERSDHSSLPLFRREYDLRWFGVGLVLDFGSSASA